MSVWHLISGRMSYSLPVEHLLFFAFMINTKHLACIYGKFTLYSHCNNILVACGLICRFLPKSLDADLCRRVHRCSPPVLDLIDHPDNCYSLSTPSSVV